MRLYPVYNKQARIAGSYQQKATIYRLCSRYRKSSNSSKILMQAWENRIGDIEMIKSWLAWLLGGKGKVFQKRSQSPVLRRSRSLRQHWHLTREKRGKSSKYKAMGA